MGRFAYIIYAIIVVLVATSLDGAMGSRGGSYRSWGNSTGFSTGSGWGGGGHK